MKKITLIAFVLSGMLTLIPPAPAIFSDSGTPTPRTSQTNALVFLPLVKQSGVPVSPTHVTSLSAPSSVNQYAKYEIVMNLSRTFPPDSFKPYYPYSDDPEGITIDAYFIIPSARTIVLPAFYYQDYLRSGSPVPTMTATNHFSWRVRFTPTEVGTYQYYIVIQDRSGLSRYPASGTLTFNTVAFNSRGFVRVSPRNSRFLEFDNGQSFIPIASGRQWFGGQGRSLEYEKAFAQFGANGINLTRVWTQNDGYALTVEGPFDAYAYPDNYNPVDRRMNINTLPKGTQINQRGARELDYIVESAQANGVYLVLSSHGDAYWIWECSVYDEPWNQCRVQPDDPRHLAQWKRNFRYQVARWGYSTAILVWEHWNELGHIVPGSAWWNFYQAYVAYQRATDPYRHLITTSQNSQAYSPAFWSSPLADLGMYHDYADFRSATYTNLSKDEAALVYLFASCLGTNGNSCGLGLGDGTTWQGPPKPFIWGEFDADVETFARVRSGEGRFRLLHNSTWAGLFSPIGTSPIDWYWDREDAATTTARYADRKLTAQFFRDVDYAGQHFSYLMTSADKPQNYNGPLVVTSDARARVYAMRGNTMVLAWVQNREYTWYNAPALPSTFTTTITIPGVTGNYAVWLYDPQTGKMTGLGTLVANGSLTVQIPLVQKDIAIKAVQQK
jgi:hypothetical protein